MRKEVPKPDIDNRTSESQRYDKLFRQNMRHIMPGIIEKVLGLSIVSSSELKDKLQTTKQLEVDALRKVTDGDDHTYILHIEIQKANDGLMPYRMLEYRSMLYLNYRLPVKQYVLYLGREKLTMPCSISEPDLQFSYPLISFADLSYRLFIDAERPEERQLAILGNLESEEPAGILEKLVLHIDRQDISNAEKNKYLQQLRILVQLRNFTKPLEDIMLKVASFFKEENDPFFRRGEAMGVAKGEQKKNYEFVSNLIVDFDFTDEQAAKASQTSIDFVQKVREELTKEKK